MMSSSSQAIPPGGMNAMDEDDVLQSERVPLSNPARRIAKHCQAMIQCINQAKDLGVPDARGLQLPLLAAIGSQGSGKSTLIETLCDIKLPRSSTRCPILFSTNPSPSPTNEWECEVSLHIVYDPMQSYSTETSPPFSIPFGPPLTQPSKLRERIQRAMLSLLSPSIDYRHYLSPDKDIAEYPTEQESELSWCANRIGVCITLGSGSAGDAAAAFGGIEIMDLPALDMALTSSASGSSYNTQANTSSQEGKARGKQVYNAANGSGQDNTTDPSNAPEQLPCAEEHFKKLQSYIVSILKDPNCLILHTLACEVKMDNVLKWESAILKKFDPEEKRTIGILTRPDLVAPGQPNEQYAIQLIRGEITTKARSSSTSPSISDSEGHWFCVNLRPSTSTSKLKSPPTPPTSPKLLKSLLFTQPNARANPSQSEQRTIKAPPNIYSKQNEKSYFTSSRLWSTLDEVDKIYLGTDAVERRVFEELQSILFGSFGLAKTSIANAIISFRNEITALPRPPLLDNPQGEVMGLVKRFVNDLEACVKGDGNGNDRTTIFYHLKQSQDPFKNTIRQTVIKFKPFNISSIQHLSLMRGGTGMKRLQEEISRLAVHPYLEMDDSDLIGELREGVAEGLTEERMGLVFIDDILNRAQRLQGRQLPSQLPPDLHLSYVDEIIAQWEEPMLLLVKQSYDICESTVIGGFVEKWFGHVGDRRRLKKKVIHVIHTHLEDLSVKTRQHVKRQLDIQKGCFTLNKCSFDECWKGYVEFYRNSRRVLTGLCGNEASGAGQAGQKNQTAKEKENTAGKTKPGGGSETVNGDRPQALDERTVDNVIKVIADVRSWFQVAYKQFVDNVAHTIDHDLIQAMVSSEDILKKLTTELEIYGSFPQHDSADSDSGKGYSTCWEYLREDDWVRGRRMDLERSLESHQALLKGYQEVERM